jgi:hypothetical protein
VDVKLIAAVVGGAGSGLRLAAPKSAALIVAAVLLAVAVNLVAFVVFLVTTFRPE